MSISDSKRAIAKAFAKGVMEKIQVPEPDIPYVETVIVEAVLFEEPMKDLEISFNPVGSFYNVTIKGYENLIDIVRWANTFLGVNRNPLLCHVTHSFMQPAGSLMVIQMNKIEFHKSSNSDLVIGAGKTGLPKKFKKRTE